MLSKLAVLAFPPVPVYFHRMNAPLNATDILDRLAALGCERNRAGMARFGVNVSRAFGVGMVALRGMAKEIGRDHELAADLWQSAAHEARILACLIDDPKLVTEEQMEAWVADLDSWDLCDQCCGALFDKTPLAFAKALQWAEREPEFERRAAFSLMAWLAVHDKKAPDERFLEFLPIIERQADDPRNFVKKAVNWALRQIGKRNMRLRAEALARAERLAARDAKAARWIGKDAARELTNEKIVERIKRK